MFNIPILYIVFNRPSETQRSFEVLKQLKPSQLYISADGVRENVTSDIDNCKAVRDYIVNNIDWDCEIKTLFQPKNLGCGTAVQTALDWFFDDVEMGIIIEDDIVPDLFFFKYADVMLNRYKDNHDIFSINGHNLMYSNDKFDYGLTNYFNMWGWATWRRSNELVKKTWPNYDAVKKLIRGIINGFIRV